MDKRGKHSPKLTLDHTEDQRLCEQPYLQTARQRCGLIESVPAHLVVSQDLERLLGASPRSGARQGGMNRDRNEGGGPTAAEWHAICDALLAPVGGLIASDAKRASSAYQDFSRLSIAGDSRPLARYLSLYLPPVRGADIGELHDYWPRESEHEAPTGDVRDQAEAFRKRYPRVDSQLLRELVMPSLESFTVE
jgi:hypothetical protein